MRTENSPARMLLAVILILFVALSAWYSLTIPLGEAPDEVPHFTYIRYLARHRSLPATTEEHEAFQPPLYYALGAVVSFWIEDEPGANFAIRANAQYDVADPRAPKNVLLHTADEDWPFRGWALAWHLVRLLSIAFGAITVWSVFQLGRVLFPDQPAIGLTMAALTAFTPQFLFLSAVVNNDNAAIAISALILWQVAALLHDPRPLLSWKRSTALGLLLGVGLLSKASLIALVPVVGLAVLIAGLRQQDSTGGKRLASIAGHLALAFGLAVILAGWYFVRNWVLFGDPLGWAFTLQVSALREAPLSWEVLAWLFRGLYRSFWLGWIGIQLDGILYWIIGAICLVGLVGFVAWLTRRWNAIRVATRWTLALLGLHALITLASLLRWTATVLGTDQARLIYPLLPTVMLVIVSGWTWWTKGKAQTLVFGGLAAGMFLLAIVTPLRYIGPVYAPAPVATKEELSAATPLDVRWGAVQLLGYRLENSRVLAGDKLVLHLYWQAIRPIDRDLMALIQLLDSNEQFLMYADGSPTAGRDTTDRWVPGIPLASEHLLAVPETGQPGEYHLLISLHEFGDPAWMGVVGADGNPLGDHIILPETVEIVAP
jgi:4-amino-4-deoxy-L-arabinose transferase-like glycosyltransferase